MLTKVILLPANHSKPVGKYSPGVSISLSAAGKLVFISGQVSTDEKGQVIGMGDPLLQTELIFKRIENILIEAGGELSDLVSLVIYIVDRQHFSSVSNVRDRVLKEPAPSSTLVVVSELVEKGCLVEISGVARIER